MFIFLNLHMPTTQAASKAEVDRESKGECLKIKSKKGAGDVYLSDRCFLVRHEILGSITVQSDGLCMLYTLYKNVHY